MTLRVIILSLFFFCVTMPVSGRQEFFPYVAEVTEDNVIVRAGQSINFEKLCRLDKGQKVIAVDKVYSWYKIDLPPEAESYVVGRYVLLLGPKMGEITANRVNVRAGPNVNRTVIAQLNEGEKVSVVEKKEDWYKIRPVVGSYGWVAEGFLKFYSSDLTDYMEAPEDAEDAEGQGAEFIKHPGSVEEEAAALKIKPDKVLVMEEPAVTIKGVLSKQIEVKNDQIHYKCITAKQTVYYLEDWDNILDEFTDMKVEIKGSVDLRLKSEINRNVLKVTKIQLVL